MFKDVMLSLLKFAVLFSAPFNYIYSYTYSKCFADVNLITYKTVPNRFKCKAINIPDTQKSKMHKLSHDL